MPVDRYGLRAVASSTAPPTTSKNPAANNTVLRLPSAVAATKKTIDPTATIAMPNVASAFLASAHFAHRPTSA